MKNIKKRLKGVSGGTINIVNTHQDKDSISLSGRIGGNLTVVENQDPSKVPVEARVIYSSYNF